MTSLLTQLFERVEVIMQETDGITTTACKCDTALRFAIIRSPGAYAELLIGGAMPAPGQRDTLETPNPLPTPPYFRKAEDFNK